MAGRRRIAVFASGSGSNFEAVAAHAAAADSPYEIALLVCDKPRAGAIARAERLGVPVYAVRPKDFASREEYEADIIRELRRCGVEFIVLAGYMRLVTSVLLNAYPDRILNIHPSLLPAFPGLDAIGQAIAYGAKVTGVTVHFVDAGLDSGPIIAQEAVAVLDGDTAETLASRIHAAEHRLYPAVVRAFAEGRIRLSGRHVAVEGGLQY